MSLSIIKYGDGRDKSGIYEAKPVNVTITKADSGAIMVNMEYELLAIETPNGFQPVPPNNGVYGSLCFRKKDGDPMEDNIREFAEAFGWNGDASTIQGKHWSNIKVLIKVDAEQYKDKWSYKATRVKKLGSSFGMKSMTDSDLGNLGNEMGGLFKQIASTAGVTAPAPAPAPVGTVTAPAPAPAAPIFESPADAAKDDVAF